MLYGRPTKHVRHVDEDTITLEPQRFYVHPFWLYDASTATSRTDGQDLENEKVCPEGSRITKHKVEILVTPETIEPQQLYIGRVKLSFNDVTSSAICGGRFTQGSYADTATENFDQNGTNPISLHLFPNALNADKYSVSGAAVANQEFGGGSSGKTMSDFMLDDNIKHWVNFKKVTVFDQRPLMGERWQRIPSKVKRINEGTFYGMVFFNDSTRGATPADTQLTINIKSYWEETAL